LGIDDRTVVGCWQTVGSEIRAINCLAFQNTGLPDIVAELRKLPYAWGTHYAPHDAQVRELGSGKSRQEIAASLGMRWTICPSIGLASGIEATRAMLSRVWFDRQNCRDLVNALKTYRTEYDDVRQVHSLKPLHSWESDFADMVRYWAVGSQGKSPDWEPIKYDDRVVA
jgi:hypothetical protein